MRLMVNGGAIGHLEARRRAHRRPPQHDDVCFYDWRVTVDGTTRSNMEDDPIAHRFGDGGWALVAKILDRAGHTWTDLDDDAATYAPLAVSDDTTTGPDEDIGEFARRAVSRLIAAAPPAPGDRP